MPAGTQSAGFRGHKTQDGYQALQSGKAGRQGDMYNMQWPPFDNVCMRLLDHQFIIINVHV